MKKQLRRMDGLVRTNASLRQKVRRLENRNVKLQNNVAELKRDDPDSLEIQRIKGGKGKRLTLQSYIALAIRRNFGNASTADVGAMLLQDISRYTVSRAESKTGTALIASSRLFFQSMIGELTSTINFFLDIHSYKQDATNSGILKGSKLGALILRSSYLKQQPPDEQEEHPPPAMFESTGWNLDDWFDSIVRVADVLPVVGSDSGTTVAQTLKQLEGLGCPTWKDVQNNPDPELQS